MGVSCATIRSMIAIPDKRNYIVHGAGGIGSVIAARLSQAGLPVSLVARGEHLAALVADGLQVEGLTNGVFRLPAAGSAHELHVDDDTIVILAMKTQDTFSAVEAHAGLYAELPILCFQNGVSNEEWLAGRGFRTYGVMVRIGATLDRPGVVRHTGARHAIVGCWPRGTDEVCETVVADLIEGSLEAEVALDVQASKWGKLVLNLINAYLALTDLPVQATFLETSVRNFVADIEQEAANVLAAEKIEVLIDGSSSIAERIERLRRPVTEARRAAVNDATDNVVSYPSTWQDLKAGRTTIEVSHFNGRIVELGRKHGIATPLNEVLWERCEDAARRQLGPGTETEASIRAAAAEG